MYAEYEFYTEQFGGSIIPQTAFNRQAIRASRYLDQVTFNRIKEVTPDIQLATCEIAEAYYNAQEHEGKEIASESVGSQSVSYVATVKSFEAKCYDLARLYLGGTNLLYRGYRP